MKTQPAPHTPTPLTHLDGTIVTAEMLRDKTGLSLHACENIVRAVNENATKPMTMFLT